MIFTPILLSFALAPATPTEAARTPPAPAVTSSAPAAPAKAASPADTASKPMPPGLVQAVMDEKANPCDDFYRYACGGWMDTTEIPADRAAYSRGFVEILERNEIVLKKILEDAAANKLPKGAPFAAKLGDYYGTCMDDKALGAAVPELKKQMKTFAGIKDGKALAKAIGALHKTGVMPLFNIGAMQDLKNSAEVIGGVDQGGLGLPDRDYYLENDEKTVSVRNAYVAYIEKMFTLLGDAPELAKKNAAAIVAFETELAKASLDKVSRRDPEKQYHRMDQKGLSASAKSFAWDAYWKALGRTDIAAVNVSWPDFFARVDALAGSTDAATWQTYLSWVLLRGSVPALPQAFADAEFTYMSTAFTGAKEDRPRWKKCVAWTDGALGEALGQVFVQQTFGDDGKARTLKMVQAVEAAFDRNLDTLSWMDDATRIAARAKVKAMRNKIGYPDVWRDYASIKTDRKSFLHNALAADAFEMNRQLGKIGKPVDRNEWQMSPPTVNAYNDPQLNEIVFPAGILQPPFFNKEATDPVNFGAMGMVVGHEITHGFDDEGRKFDATGSLKDWWTEAAGKKFVEKTGCVKKQFDGYTAIDDIKVNGALTLGENVADLGGLKISYQAMQSWMKESPERMAYRFTPEQQFFLGFAQTWCTKMRPEMARLRAKTDPHSPAFLRVLGPLSNTKAFFDAFHCTDKAKMARAPKDRCETW